MNWCQRDITSRQWQTLGKHFLGRHEANVASALRRLNTALCEARFGKEKEGPGRAAEQGTSFQQLVEHVDVDGTAFPFALAEDELSVGPFEDDADLLLIPRSGVGAPP